MITFIIIGVIIVLIVIAYVAIDEIKWKLGGKFEGLSYAEMMKMSVDERDYYYFVRTTTWCYVIAAVAILLLPFLKRSEGGTVLGFNCNPPVPLIFAGFSVFGLAFFAWRVNKDVDKMKTFNVIIPLVLAVVSVFAFLVGGRFFVDTFRPKVVFRPITWEQWSNQFASGLHYLGPLIYCVSLSIASLCTLMLNKIVNRIKELHPTQKTTSNDSEEKEIIVRTVFGVISFVLFVAASLCLIWGTYQSDLGHENNANILGVVLYVGSIVSVFICSKIHFPKTKKGRSK